MPFRQLRPVGDDRPGHLQRGIEEVESISALVKVPGYEANRENIESARRVVRKG